MWRNLMTIQAFACREEWAKKFHEKPAIEMVEFPAEILTKRLLGTSQNIYRLSQCPLCT